MLSPSEGFRRVLYTENILLSWGFIPNKGSSEVGGSPALVYRFRQRSPNQIGGLRASSEVNETWRTSSEVVGPVRSFVEGRRDLEKSDRGRIAPRRAFFLAMRHRAFGYGARLWIWRAPISCRLSSPQARLYSAPRRALRLGARLFAPLTILVKTNPRVYTNLTNLHRANFCSLSSTFLDRRYWSSQDEGGVPQIVEPLEPCESGDEFEEEWDPIDAPYM
ncbi:hypothetical protein Acr_17g0008850 [Actinidia rufa]|uniref:Uncharacterized protein n=1 Tax=Actinidia rufa TaxID=165716 RepID=A0A7J0G3F7_9ERIC|nr:hypothetical protein Acr_17g0008850 [Actinidia rufa]